MLKIINFRKITQQVNKVSYINFLINFFILIRGQFVYQIKYQHEY